MSQTYIYIWILSIKVCFFFLSCQKPSIFWQPRSLVNVECTVAFLSYTSKLFFSFFSAQFENCYINSVYINIYHMESLDCPNLQFVTNTVWFPEYLNQCFCTSFSSQCMFLSIATLLWSEEKTSCTSWLGRMPLFFCLGSAEFVKKKRKKRNAVCFGLEGSAFGDQRTEINGGLFIQTLLRLSQTPSPPQRCVEIWTFIGAEKESKTQERMLMIQTLQQLAQTQGVKLKLLLTLDPTPF